MDEHFKKSKTNAEDEHRRLSTDPGMPKEVFQSGFYKWVQMNTMHSLLQLETILNKTML